MGYSCCKEDYTGNKDTPGADTSVMFRKKATGTNGCSQPVTILFKGQKAAPVIGFLETCDVVYSYETRTVGGLKNMYHTLKFKKGYFKTAVPVCCSFKIRYF